MFHVEQCNLRTEFRGILSLMQFDGGKRGISNDFRKVFYFVVVAPTSTIFFLPTNKYLRNDCGTAIGSCHSH